MAIGDPDAPEDFGRRIGGNPRTIGRKRPRPAKKGDWASFIRELPAEYADFRLEDGRTFGEVMGADILGPPSGADGGEPMTPEFHEKVREGNYDLAGIVRDNPDRFAPPRGKLKTRPASPPPRQEETGLPVPKGVNEAGFINLPAGPEEEDAPVPEGDNEAEFINLPFGPEEGDEPDNTTDFRHPEGIGATLSGLDGDVPDVDPQAETDSGDDGQVSLIDDWFEFDELVARKPTTYDGYMHNARKIGEAAGISDFGIELLAIELADLSKIEEQIVNSPANVRTIPSRRQPRPADVERAKAEAEARYRKFVEKALARRDTPIDFPRIAGAAINMDLVHRRFVYKTGDSVFFMIDPGRTRFIQVRRRQTPGADGSLFEPIPKGESVSIRDMMFRANGRGPYVTHRIPTTKDGRMKVSDLGKDVVYEVEDGRFFQLDDMGKNFREMRRLSTPDEQGRGFVPIPDQQSPLLTADLRARQGGYGPPIIPQPLRLADKFGNILSPIEIEADARALAEQAGRGRLLAIQVGTKAIEAADFKRRLDDARFTAAELGIDPNNYPDISQLENAYRREMQNLQALRIELLDEIKPELVSVEKMTGRADDPGILKNIINAGVQGIGDEILNIPEEAVIEIYRDIYRMEKRFDRLDQGEKWQTMVAPKLIVKAFGIQGKAADFLQAVINGEDPTFLLPTLFGLDEAADDVPIVDILTVAYGLAGKRTRDLIKDAMAIGPVMDFPPMQTVAEARSWLKQEFERNPKLAESFSDRLAYGTGRVLPVLLTAYAMKNAGWLRGGLNYRIVGSLDAAMAEGIDRFHESLNDEDSIEEAFIKHDLGMWFGGVIEYIQLPRLFSVADKETGGKIKKILLNAVETGGQGLAKQTALKIWQYIEDRFVVTKKSDGEHHTVELPDGPVIVSTKAFEQMVAILIGL